MDAAVRRGVRARLDPALVDAAIEALTARAPSDRIAPIERGWVVRDEVPWFALFAAVALLALALLAHAGSSRAPGFPRSFLVLPWLFDLGWIAMAYLFAQRLWGSLAIVLDGPRLVIERAVRGKSVWRCAIDPEDLQAVRVANDRVVSVEGPRNEPIATVFTAGLLDPPTLAKWIADAVIALSERALAR